MHKTSIEKPGMEIAGHGLCIPDDETATTLGFSDVELNIATLPAMMRRRTSLATRIAISALEQACSDAQVEKNLPAIFVSSVGEMQVTNKLCQAIATEQYPLSPTLFHNSVHNTAAGYWSIATGSSAPMQAMSGLEDGFALGLLEAWCQLQTVADKVLLVCYDENMPQSLLPDYHWEPLALAFVLKAKPDGRFSLSIPVQAEAQDKTAKHGDFASTNPAMAGLPLIKMLRSNLTGTHRVQLSPGTRPWFADLLIS